jgi:cardiolipin synthase
MSWQVIDGIWEELLEWAPLLLTAFTLIVSALTIAQVLMTKTDSTSAVSWCLLVMLVPLLGALIYLFFGNQHISRTLERKRRHKRGYRQPPVHLEQADSPDEGGLPLPPPPAEEEPVDDTMARLAQQLGAFEPTAGNRVSFFHEGKPAFDAMLEAMRGARHHIHLQTFIFQPDRTAQLFLDVLTQKAREKVEVRLLYDAMGSFRFHRGLLLSFLAAGGKASAFLPLNPFRRRVQINLRNHRKILVVDGHTGFVGGLNIGDEYLGKVPRFGFWRDTHLRIEGRAVRDLQRVFVEDWDFAAGERLEERAYFPAGVARDGPYRLQIIDSGPDRELKAIREMYFAAILHARKRVWIASPYFVPDAGLRDALRLAGFRGVDVRLLGQYQPDKWVPLFAARYYWREMVEAGVKVYQYTRGMLHAKVVLVDDQWASVGTANLDNRSLHLNFEVNCLIYSRTAVAELEAAFLRDLSQSIRLVGAVYRRRPFAGRLLENACRLLSPIL